MSEWVDPSKHAKMDELIRAVEELEAINFIQSLRRLSSARIPVVLTDDDERFLHECGIASIK